jgi:hypothetical protein
MLQLGLQIMRAFMEQAIESRLGRHGSHSHYRHGQQPGYVVYGGRKLERPAMRSVQGKEARSQGVRFLRFCGWGFGNKKETNPCKPTVASSRVVYDREFKQTPLIC